jgi:hypothetical protein
MSTTNLEAIRVAIEKKLLTITPTNLVQIGNSRGFTLRSSNTTWEKSATSDQDRRFVVSVSSPSVSKSFGTLTEHEAEATLVVEVGHLFLKDRPESELRRVLDVNTIAQNLEKSSNYPASVWRIHPRQSNVTVNTEKLTVTKIEFDLIYSEANV